MANGYKVGNRAVHLNRATVGGPLVTDTQVFGASETEGEFSARVNEMATLCAAARGCRDATAMTAIQTRIAAIDD